MFIPFEADKALAMPSSPVWSLPLWPSTAPPDMGLLGGKANKRRPEGLGRRRGVIRYPICEAQFKREEKAGAIKAAPVASVHMGEGFNQASVGFFLFMVGFPSSHGWYKPHCPPHLLQLGH